MRYICVNCRYIFDESLGDAEEGIEPCTRIEDVHMCPSCDQYDTFQGIREEVNSIESQEDMSDAEIEHYPIVVPKENGIIEVTVGDPSHPMGEDHRICSIALYDEYGDLVREDLFLPETEPVSDFDVSDLDEYEVVVRCNIHGSWGVKIKQ